MSIHNFRCSVQLIKISIRDKKECLKKKHCVQDVRAEINPVRVIGRVHTCTFTRRAYRSRTVRVGLPVYTLRPLRRVRPVHSDHIERCSRWTRTVRVGLALQCECSGGRVGYGSDAPSAHVCRLTYIHTYISSSTLVGCSPFSRSVLV